MLAEAIFDSKSGSLSILILVKFRIKGNLRFLSHAETVRVFQRACARAGVKVRYSQGFNPRPKLSLPLPRSVGVASDDELLCLQVEDSPESFDGEKFKAELSGQLPECYELLSVEAAKTKRAPVAEGVVYVLTVRPGYANDKLKAGIKHLLASENLRIERRIDAKGNIKNIDVRAFLKSIKLKDKDITVECKITQAGSIRVDEILKLLELDIEKLTAPVRRAKIQWQNN